MKKGKVAKTMHEFKHHALHSGSKKGPLVKNRKQAIAIALNQAGDSSAGIPQDHSNPIEYLGSGLVDSVADGGGQLQIIDATEMLDQFGEGQDEFLCDFGDRPDLTWPGSKVKKFPRRQAY